MIESKVPGIKAQHAVITPACRTKGLGVAFDEAVDRLRKEYLACQVSANVGADYHLVLTVDRKPST